MKEKNLNNRIKSGKMLYIDLEEKEFSLYRGEGIVLFEEYKGEIIDIFYVIEDVREKFQKEFQGKFYNEDIVLGKIYEILLFFSENKSEHKIFVGRASCYQICNPILLTKDTIKMIFEKIFLPEIKEYF